MKEIKAFVSDPQTEKEGRRDAFTTYLVSTDKTSVRRRYSDFQWLCSRLQTELPGAIVPTIPHKMAVGKKFDPHFIETRRRHLQKFLNVIVNHEELQRAPSMTPFMVDKFGGEFDKGRKKVETDNPTSTLSPDDDPPSAAKKVSNIFAKAGTLMRVRAGKKDLMESPEEEKIGAIQTYIGMVESQIRVLAKSAEAMTQSTGQMAKVVSDMNEPIQEWRTGYQEYTKVSDEVCDMMGALLDFTKDYSQLMEFKHSEEQLEFEDVMLRLSCDVQAFKVALKQRRHWQVALTTTTQQIASKEDQIAKATFNLKPPEVTSKLSHERSELQRRAGREKSKFEECTTRFLKESTRSKQRLELQLKEAFLKYGKIQIAYTDRINTAWNQLLPYVGGITSAGDSCLVSEEEEARKKSEEEVDVSAPVPPAVPPPPPPGENLLESEELS